MRSIEEKIDQRLLEKICCLSVEKRFPCFVYFNSMLRTYYILRKKNIEIKNEYLFINAFLVNATKDEIIDMASECEVRYISSLPVACTLMNVAKNILSAKETSCTGQGVGVAFIDTGIACHADFVIGENRIKLFKDFINSKATLYDDNGHGTFVAGVCAGCGALSHFKFSGIAPRANIFALKALDCDGEATANKILDAMEWLYDNHKKLNIKVVCMSFGSEPIGKGDPIMLGANALWEDGVVVVAAAGNSGPKSGTIKSPGISPEIITVGGFDDNRYDDKSYNQDFFEMAKFSSRGPALKHLKPDIIAPSVDIISCGREEFYTTLSGTSVATPMIAGAVCLMLEKDKNLLPRQVKDKLLQSAKSIGFDVNSEGYGVPNIKKILE